ncbi:MAG TPA: hypothetical protein VM657_14645 [Sphingomonas sp.]|nr:hypothetical protein [Sphingomonas sp.]
MAENPSQSVGLGGDGDEIEAIDDVERVFGVKLDSADAQNWLTAGDVFATLQKALTAAELNEPDLWKRFAATLCGVTGVNPDDIDRNSPLLSQSGFWARLAGAAGVVSIIIIAGLLVLLAIAALT